MILMGLLVVSFAIWGIADIFRGYGTQTLIKVGDTEITLSGIFARRSATSCA